jgi:hypothetical protein
MRAILLRRGCRKPVGLHQPGAGDRAAGTAVLADRYEPLVRAIGRTRQDVRHCQVPVEFVEK